MYYVLFELVLIIWVYFKAGTSNKKIMVISLLDSNQNNNKMYLTIFNSC